MPETQAESKDSISTLFADADNTRTSKLDRAKEAAELTIPGLFPRDAGNTEQTELTVPYSSDGAKGVMTLASRIVSTLLPLNGLSFFTVEMDPILIGGQESDTTELDEILSRSEQKIMDRLEASNYRQALFIVYQHLIVIGDCLLEQQDDFTFQVHRLDNYIVKRDPSGKVKEIILREWVDPGVLPDEFSNLENQDPNAGGNSEGFEGFYTRIVWEPNAEHWLVSKEFRGHILEQDVTFEIPRYTPLRWTGITGENYGRSLVEENVGDLRAVDSLSRSIIEGAAANAEFRFLVDPSGITSIDDLWNTSNGAFVAGREEDIFVLQLGSPAQLQVALAAKEQIQANLGRAFLLNSAIQPEGERVTATQVRLLANELEQALGGVFSSTAREIQLPILRRTILLMVESQSLPEEFADLLGDQTILQLHIRTGLEALGREVENSKLQLLGEEVRGWPEEWAGTIIAPEYVRRRLINMGIDPIDLVKTQQDIEAEQQAQQQALTQQQASEQAIQSGGAIAEQQAAAQQQQPQQ